MHAQPLGELLVERALISATDLSRALQFQTEYGGRLGSVLVRLGALSEEALLPVLALQLGIPIAQPEDLPQSHDQLLRGQNSAGVSASWLASRQAVLWQTEAGYACASRDPNASVLQESVEQGLGQAPQWYFLRSADLALLESLQSADRRYGEGDAKHLRELAEEAPVIEFVNTIMAEAVDARASDIHLEPEETTFAVRLRVDGLLQTRRQEPRERFDAVASRIKLIAGLDIAERRLPQDGRYSTRAGGTDLDIRVSTIPSKHGESIVLRLLPKARRDLDLKTLGLANDYLATLERFAREPNGIVLVTGPTGSGKSTTLYATLGLANAGAQAGTRKIITVEDPIEYKMRGIVQIQAQSEIGYTFARALRAMLRHDPDIIMVGEIRDRETAEIAVQAALTGHMVFSTLHTNSAVASFGRLLDMGIEPFLVVSSVRAIVAQRLARKLCQHCAVAVPASTYVENWWREAERRQLPGLPLQPRWKKAVGCAQCSNSGYFGRTGVHEIVELTPAIKALVLERAPASAIALAARDAGVRFMLDDGLSKAAQGITTADEVLRVVGDAESDAGLEPPAADAQSLSTSVAV